MSNIATAIRRAALEGRLGFQRLGCVESHILHTAFLNPSEQWCDERPNIHWRTYMLFVACALDADAAPGTPNDQPKGGA